MIRAARLLLFLLAVLSGTMVGSAWACENIPTAQPAAYGPELGEPDQVVTADGLISDRDGKRDGPKNCGGCCGVACAPSAMSYAATVWISAGTILRVSDARAETWHGRLVPPPLPPPRPTV